MRTASTPRTRATPTGGPAFSERRAEDENSRVDAVLARHLPTFERLLEPLLGRRLALAAAEFLVFGIKQAWACLFGGLMLLGIIATAFYWPEGSPLARYDFLVLWAVGIQVAFLLTKLERPREALVIFIFHAVGTAMEVFKVEQGSWAYPEESVLRLGDVPLFSGFMYAAVGSYLARVTRVLDFRFTNYPKLWMTVLLAALIYANFFAHHYLPDIRWWLVLATGLLWGRSWVHYRVWRFQHRMPLLLGFALVALFIFLAENLGTLAGAWFYPGQEDGWKPVSLQKYPAWLLLMILSFVLVTLVHRPAEVTEGN
ncbi:DUF817 domain-containing protein [Parvularcula maris]|uniref:DUF817 domain-containing protein n=1 Tax=Parvularcula maris TaxID=2965077 RepID=A0A9X2RIQ8_9PROT|nr:DUF817 domain-containing protein [Parvularcula maris]MCQ8186299.1 DUF817 domain-containing protein [Parvularcula maris]